jgi:hypothetical protein
MAPNYLTMLFYINVTDSLKKSFVYRGAASWNKLPSDMIRAVVECQSVTVNLRPGAGRKRLREFCLRECLHLAADCSTLYYIVVNIYCIDRFHLTSRRPYWCTKTMQWRPYWCTVRELALSYSNISYCFTTPLGPPITWVKTIYNIFVWYTALWKSLIWKATVFKYS